MKFFRRYLLNWDEIVSSGLDIEIPTQLWPSWIGISRFPKRTIIYNVREKEFFRLTFAPKPDHLLINPGQAIFPVTMRDWLKAVGWKRGLVEILESHVGMRLIGAIIDRFHPPIETFEGFSPPVVESLNEGLCPSPTKK